MPMKSITEENIVLTQGILMWYKINIAQEICEPLFLPIYSTYQIPLSGLL